ncbi:MAG: aspartate/glutamate racemase family protein [Janthinobacterium lividum]
MTFDGRNNVVAMKRIGILGGSSDQATTDYYQRLNKAAGARLGGWNTAELIITSMNFAFSEHCVRHGRWTEMGDYLADRASALERGGADFYLCVSNTLHRTADRFTRDISIPFLHIVDPTAQAIVNQGLRRVALLGTKPVMSMDFMKSRYLENFGVEIMTPSSDQQDIVDRIIFDELCRGQFTSASKKIYLDIIDDLADRGADGIILGCTEIPLLVTQADRPALPMFDTAGLHVDAAIDLAIRSDVAT